MKYGKRIADLLTIARALLIISALRWRRLRDEYLPEFFAAVSSLRGK